MRMFGTCLRGSLVALVAMAAGGLFATDYTWKYGGTDYKWSTPGNWLVNGETATSYPKGGDKAIFSKANVTAAITLVSETVDLGSGELTIQVDVTSYVVYLYTIFSGSAKIIKTGTGRLTFGKDQGVPVTNLWTGGLEVRNGQVNAGGGGVQTFGTGTVTLKPESDSALARIGPGSWVGIAVSNRVEIVFSGLKPRTTADLAAIYTSNSGSLSGPVFADSDFAVSANSAKTGMFTFNGPVEAAGHTIHLYVAGGYTTGTQGYVTFNKKINASLVLHKGSSSLPHCRTIIDGVTEEVDNSLTIIDGSNVFSSASAYWGGTNIVINPNKTSTSPRLKVASGTNINPDAVVTLTTGGFIEVPSGVFLGIRKLIVDGTDVGSGFFTSAELPCITGAGTVIVGIDAATWIGGSTGSWNSTANWSLGTVPKAGMVAIFQKSVTLTDAVDFGDPAHPEESLVIDVASGLTVTTTNDFSGVNGIVKRGAGVWNVQARQTYTGGTVIEDGDFTIQGVWADGVWSATWPGTGPIEIRRSASCTPHLVLSSWTVVSNKVLITGPYKQDVSNYGDIKFNNVSSFYSDIELGDDADAFRFHNQYNNKGDRVASYGDVSAHGKTMYLTSRSETDEKGYWANVWFYGTVDANIEKCNLPGHLEFLPGSRIGTSGLAGESGSTVTLLAATNIAHAASATASAAQILAGTITVDSAAGRGAALRVQARENLQQTAKLCLTNGGKLIVDGGVRAAVARLFVDGVEVERGTYTAEELPDSIGGAGSLRVGSIAGGLIIFH